MTHEQAIKAIWLFSGIFSLILLVLAVSFLPDIGKLRREFHLYFYDPPTRMECLDATNPGWRDDLPKGRNPWPYFIVVVAMIALLGITMARLISYALL